MSDYLVTGPLSTYTLNKAGCEKGRSAKTQKRRERAEKLPLRLEKHDLYIKAKATRYYKALFLVEIVFTG